MSCKRPAYLIEEIFRRLYFFLGKRNLICALWWGVEIGKRPLFDGKCCFKKHPNSAIKIGNDCKFRSRSTSNLIGINRPCIISTQAETATVVIGDFCGFSGTVVGAFKKIRIGNHVRCGANTLITDSDWHSEDPRSGKPEDVVIEDNVWLGVNSVVLKGVTIGENTVIGANSVVTKNIPANVIAAGNPCKVVRAINEK